MNVDAGAPAGGVHSPASSGTAAVLSAGVAMYPTQPPQEMRRLTQLGEELGYANLWFGDSQNIWRDAYVTMGAAAVGTERIVIGSGVTNVVTRHTSVLASAWATLSELTNGRVAAGIGTGFTSVRTMGLQATRVCDLERAVDELRALWRGESVTHHESDSPYRLSYLEELPKVPVYLAATGPRLLRLAGRIADGVIILVGTHRETVRDALDMVAAGAEEVGRTLDDLHKVLWCPSAVEDDGDRARDQVRPHVASTVMVSVRGELEARELEDVVKIREAYDYYDHMIPDSPHARLVSDGLVNRFAIAGNPAECRERVVDLATTGIDQISIIPFPAPGDDRSDTMEGFASVMRMANQM